MSIKKSSVFVIAVIVIVTLVQIFFSGGNAMEIAMGEEVISFSGIDDFKYEVAYNDIASAELVQIDEWEPLGGHEFGPYRVGEITNKDGQEYVLFATVRAGNAVKVSLSDGKQVIFNYNTTGSTEEIYKMLLKNIG